MAIFHGHYIDGGFTMPFYKVIRLLLLIGRSQRLICRISSKQYDSCQHFIFQMLLNKSITLADIEAVDPDLHQSLTWMLDNCIEVRENGEGNFDNQNQQLKNIITSNYT